MNPLLRLAFVTVACGLLLLLAAVPASADDRDLVRTSVGDPYVFILFDVSGSMNWSTRCTAEDIAAGFCDFRCDDRDCFVPLNMDDPNSKFHQAKDALHEVISQVDNVEFGFATYNQDVTRVRGKHWLYRATTPGVTLAGGDVFPAIGADDVFGTTWRCDRRSSVACDRNSPADLTDAWERTRAHRLPKLGATTLEPVSVFVESGGTTYEVTYTAGLAAGQALGDATIDVDLVVRECSGGNCNKLVGRPTVSYELVDEFISWDFVPSRTTPQNGYFHQADASDSLAGDTCAGWDPNDDSADDEFLLQTFRWPTTNTNDPREEGGSSVFTYGDVVPLDWTSDNKDLVLEHLGPNGRFDVAPFFQDQPNAFGVHELKNPNGPRPMVAFGSTPLGNSIKSFRTWWAGCPQGKCPNDTGWSDIAAKKDPDWACRNKYLLVISDGDETCGGADACSGTAALRAQEGIRTFVVGFGVQNTPGNRLTCMASNGGTGSPIFPQNKQELVEALGAIFGEIEEERRAFSSAAAPRAEATTADKIYLSDFTPLSGESVWAGELDAFVKPLPLDPNDVPDETRTCDATRTSGCHLWDAAEVTRDEQGRTRAEIDAGQNPLGVSNADRRRVFYPRPTFSFGTDERLPNHRLTFFEAPGDTDTSGWIDLFEGFGFASPFAAGPGPSPDKDRAEEIIDTTLSIKTATINPVGGSPFDIDYLVGDTFHFTPRVSGSPRSFDLFAADLKGQGLECDGSEQDPGYRCFNARHQFRRKMLVAGANDGMLHFYDAGVFDQANDEFTNGTGKELFAYVPRMAMPIVRDQAEGSTHIYGVDGATLVRDVFIDPLWEDPSGPRTQDREWRTVLVGGMREAGSKMGGGFVDDPEDDGDLRTGYYALDITQPDPISFDSSEDPQRWEPTVTLEGSAPRQGDSTPGCLVKTQDADMGNVPASCGTLPFPAVLWEFTDTSALTGAAFDEDGNTRPDLAHPWSQPVVTRIQIENAGGQSEDRFVTILGGGVDPGNKRSLDPGRGNFIYIIDVETGRAIYKREVEGAVPSIESVDTDGDNLTDTIYAGTTAGRLYKVDISEPMPLEAISVNDVFGTPTTVERVTASEWDPFVVFETDQPIFYAPQVFFISRLGSHGIAFGTGDRESPWNFTGERGRLYVIVDENFQQGQLGLPKTESDYEQIDPDGRTLGAATDFLLDPPPGNSRGWFFLLDADELVITKPFTISGILIFSSFEPQVVVETEGQGREETIFCARTGDTRNFVVFTANADPLASLDENPGDIERYRRLSDFASEPFVEQAHTGNIDAGSEGGGTDTPPSAEECLSDPRLAEIVEVLKARGPENARYANYFLRIGQRMSRGETVYPACIPVAINQRNWKEN